MSTSGPDEVTQLLVSSDLDTAERAKRLLPIVYEHLRGVAHQRMAGERRDHTLDATALVHEAYLRLVGERDLPWQNRAHFFAAAAEAMRQILIDHARARGRQKRGGTHVRQVSSLLDLAAIENSEEILALDEAFSRLNDESPTAADVVRLRFYAGMSVDDTAAALDISPRQVDRLWSFARAWLYRAVNQSTP